MKIRVCPSHFRTVPLHGLQMQKEMGKGLHEHTHRALPAEGRTEQANEVREDLNMCIQVWQTLCHGKACVRPAWHDEGQSKKGRLAFKS